MGKAKVLIFDFDGTVADSFSIAVGIFRRFAGSKHSTDDAAVERLRGIPAREVIREFNVHWWQMPILMYEARKAVRLKLPTLKPITGMSPVLERLHADGHRLFIVSTNSSKNIAQFLHNNKLEKYFERIYGGSGLFDKAGALQKIVRTNGIAAKDCYYIGDEVRDLDAARKAGMPCISVSWGFNNEAALKKAQAKLLIDKPRALLQLLAVE